MSSVTPCASKTQPTHPVGKRKMLAAIITNTSLLYYNMLIYINALYLSYWSAQPQQNLHLNSTTIIDIKYLGLFSDFYFHV